MQRYFQRAILWAALLVTTSVSAQQNSDSLLHIWNNEAAEVSARFEAGRLLATSALHGPQPDSAIRLGLQLAAFANAHQLSEQEARGWSIVVDAA